MTLLGNFKRFLYSGAANSNVSQNDPALSLGGFRPDNAAPQNSEPYSVGNFDAASTSRYIVEDTQTDTPGSSDAAVGDWLVTMSGVSAPGFGRVVDVDYVSHRITLDRALPALAASGNAFRVCKRQNLFPDATLGQVQSGVVDHRMIYAFKQNVGTENNFRFWVDPIQPNGCDIEIVASGTWIIDAASVSADSSISVPTESPFNEFGRVLTTSSDWAKANQPRPVYSEAAAVPVGGSGNSSDEGALAIWIRRRIPANAAPGECVFLLNLVVPNATSQDPAASPVPFRSGFIFSWNNPEPTYAIRIFADRLLHTGGAARIFGEVLYTDGTPAVGLNAILSKASGPGTLTADPDARTDVRGRVEAHFLCPPTSGIDPVFRLAVPASTRL